MCYFFYKNKSIDIDKNYRKYSQHELNYFNDYISETFIKDFIDVPCIIILSPEDIVNFNNIVLEETDIKEYNNLGLHIFCFEIPTLSRTKELLIDIDNEIDFIDLSSEQKFIQGRSLISGFNNDTEVICYDFDFIENFCKKNNLTNVTVYSGLYRSSDLLNYKFKTKTLDIFCSAICKPSDKNTTFSFNKNVKLHSSKTIKKKFISLNKRYELFREIISYHLLKKDSIVSFYKKYTDQHVKLSNKVTSITEWDYWWADVNNRAWTDISWLLKKHKIPHNLILDDHYVDKNRNDNDWLTLDDDAYFEIPEHFYMQAFCAIVNESTFAHPFAHFADKTLNAVKSQRPFIVVGPPKTLEYMKELGFRTFGQWWDESYDQEIDHTKRLDKIIDLINCIDSYSLTECKYMYDDMIDIIQHNYNMMYKLRKGIEIASTK